MIREQHGPRAYELVENVRRQAVGDYRAGSGESALDRLLDLPKPDMILLIRAFTIFSQLANTADDHIARRQTKAMGSGSMQRMELSAGLSAPAGQGVSGRAPCSCR